MRAGLRHAIRLREIQAHRRLHHDVPACLRRPHRDVAVRRRADDCEVDVATREQRVESRVVVRYSALRTRAWPAVGDSTAR